LKHDDKLLVSKEIKFTFFDLYLTLMTTSIKPDHLNSWLDTDLKTFIIAGPCSVETEEQIHTTAKALSSYHIPILRGGIWKPRTRPGSFTGLGTKGIQWLADAAKANNMKSAVEVATAQHVEDCLKAGIDILWIGARSTVSPFVVQEIADALRGVDMPILIKNPINPDIELWIGAIERINHAGITKIAAIHRGFSQYEKNTYRNTPNWNIPLELKRMVPNLPVICDPSHICGSIDLIQHISQKAMDLNFDGLMIESHYDPSIALSDKDQQLKPAELAALIEHLIIRDTDSENIEFKDQLLRLRTEIDKIDFEVLELIASRLKLIQEIGIYKKENNITIFQPERWAQIVESRKKYGKEIHLSEEMILDLVKLIHRESISIQTKVMQDE
jgi:chorismate mutase